MKIRIRQTPRGDPVIFKHSLMYYNVALVYCFTALPVSILMYYFLVRIWEAYLDNDSASMYQASQMVVIFTVVGVFWTILEILILQLYAFSI